MANLQHIYVGLCLLSTALVSHAFIAYDCSNRSMNVSTVAMSSVEKCDIPRATVHNSTEYVQVIQLGEIVPVIVRQCKMQISRHVYYCGMHSHISAVSNGYATYMHQMGTAMCKQAHESRSIMLPGGRIISSLNINKTTTYTVTLAGTLDSSGACTRVSYTDSFGSWDYVVVQGSVTLTLTEYQAEANTVKDMIRLRSGITCKLSKGSCVDHEAGETIWEYKDVSSCDTRTHNVLYDGYVSKLITTSRQGTTTTTYLLESSDRVFALKITGTYTRCPVKVHTTEHPKILVYAPDTPSPFFKRSYIDAANLDLMTYMNSKFVFLDRTLGKSLNDLYVELEYRRCLTERKSLQTLLSLAVINPTEFAYAYMEQPGYTAVVTGEVVHIIQCTPVEVTYRKTSLCYHELPISYQNKSLFMTPRGRLIQSHGIELRCDVIMEPQYMLQGSWYGLNPNLHAISPPVILTPQSPSTWTYTSPEALANSGLYSSDELDRLRQQIMYPSEREAISNIIFKRSMGTNTDLQGINLENALPADHIENMAKKISTRLWGWFSEFGQVSAGFLGIYMLLRIFKFLLDSIIHAKALHEVFGRSFKILACIWDSVTTYLLSRAHKRDDDKDKCLSSQPLDKSSFEMVEHQKMGPHGDHIEPPETQPMYPHLSQVLPNDHIV